MDTSSHQPKVQGPIVSRLGDFMSHVTQYQFKGSSRLATDGGLTRRHVTRLLGKEINPSFHTVARLTEALEHQLNTHIDPRDIFAEWGEFLTPHVCDLIPHCKGCLPTGALDEFGRVRPEFQQVKSGEWVTSKYPFGYSFNERSQWK